jgi:hypothetical protein
MEVRKTGEIGHVLIGRWGTEEREILLDPID